MNTRLRLTLTNHVVCVFKKKSKSGRPQKIQQKKCLNKIGLKKSIKQVRGEGGLASLAKKDWMNTRLRLTLTNHVVCVFKKKVKIWQTPKRCDTNRLNLFS